ncbi:MAG: hypothetical protein EU535_03745 [Promethearchaeota archaeon]|nr:MAG: hypothetical protein EU535_03745 [Candidatus Lokiarchaeota archaeon]
MIFKLIIKKHKKGNNITAWIQKHKEIEEDLKEIFEFFKNNIKISKKKRFHSYYQINSENPAIILSIFTTIHEIIPEIYFKNKFAIGDEEILNLENY